MRSSLDADGWGPHPLLEAAVRRYRPPTAVDVEITLHSDAPAGASTGTSAAVVVAMLGALDRLSDGSRSVAEIARHAHAVETEDLGQQSGVAGSDCLGDGRHQFHRDRRLPARRGDADRRCRPGHRRAAATTVAHLPWPATQFLRRPRSCRLRPRAPWPGLRAARGAPARGRAGARRRAGGRSRRPRQGDARQHRGPGRSASWPGVAARPGESSTSPGRMPRPAGRSTALAAKADSITLLGASNKDTRDAMLHAIAGESPALQIIPIEISRAGLRVWEANSVTPANSTDRDA